MDVATDVLSKLSDPPPFFLGICLMSAVTIIPINLLWKVQIRNRIKVELGLVFSLTLFTMIVAIIRVVTGLRGQQEDDPWLYVMGAIESASGTPLAPH